MPKLHGGHVNVFRPGKRDARVVIDNHGYYTVEKYKPPKNPDAEPKKQGESLVTASLLASNDRHVQRSYSIGDHESI